MGWLDYVVIGIIGISILLSVIHGFVRELLALTSWVLAFLVARAYAVTVAPLMPTAIPGQSLRLLAAFLIVFLSVLLVTTLLAIALSSLVRSAGLGAADRGLGAVFGLIRGLAIVMTLVLLAGLTSLPKEQAWRHAILSRPLEAMARIVKGWLPYDLSKHINYNQQPYD